MFGIENRTAFMVLLMALNVFGDNSTHPSHNITEVNHNITESAKSGSNIDSHGSKLLQTVPLVAEHTPHVISIPTDHSDNFTQIVRLEDVLMMFDLKELAAKWATVRKQLRLECQQDMTEYFRGLQEHRMWAVKSKLQFGHRLLHIFSSLFGFYG